MCELLFFSFVRPIKIGAFDFEKKCEELAQRTDGFSGREIAKLLAACQVRLNNGPFILHFFLSFFSLGICLCI
jgi:hypothetical protein